MDNRKRSWMRVEPLTEGVRIELHLHQMDSSDKALKQLRELLRRVQT
ncbi:MAG: hypothetical protein IIA45_13780 [Bacteroidetes bacterium]|nr:hypothetical protein [Bacteroidota bacterium]